MTTCTRPTGRGVRRGARSRALKRHSPAGTPHAPVGLVACAVVLAWACAAGATEPAGLPARIISLAPSITETLFALGAGPRVVAVSTYCDYPPEVAKLPKIGSFLLPNVEAIVALTPDVVIGTPSPGNEESVAALRRLGVRVDVVETERLADLPKATRAIAAAAGVPAAGERLIGDIEREMALVRERVAGAPTRRVLMAIGQDPLIAVGERSYLGELLAEARAVNVAPPGSTWPHLTIEYVIAADPEVIIDSSMGTEEGRASAAFWDRFASIAAVRNGHVHAFRSLRVLRPGPRLPVAFADLARLVHPERWP